MDYWEKFDKTLLPVKDGFYRDLNMEDIADADSKHRKRVCKHFETKNLGGYRDPCVQSDALLHYYVS